MALTTEDLEALEESIALGIRTVRYANGKEVRYHSLAEMLQALAWLRRKLGVDTGKPQRKVMSPTKGIVPPRSLEYREGW